MPRLPRLAHLALLTLALAACGGDPEPTGAPSLDTSALDAERAALRDYILGITPAALPGEQAPVETEATAATEIQNATLTKCTYHRYEGTAVYDSLVSFDPNADALFPGSIVQSKTLPAGLLSPVALPRMPGTITLSNAVLAGGGAEDAPSYSAVVAAPSQASVAEAIQGILADKQVHLAAKASFVSEQAHSLEEAALKSGVSVDWMSGSVKASFEGDWTKSRSSFVVRFTQSYYTVSFAAPASPDAVFADGVSVDDARPYMGLDNPPGYVASVTYGRMLFVKIESEDAESDVKAAIDAVFTAGVVDGAVDVSGEVSDVMNRATVTVFALGGSPSDAVDIMTSSTDRAAKIQSYFAKGATFSADSPGAPIAYTVRSLRDNAPVKVASTIDYSIPECVAEASTLHLVLDGFDVPKNGEAIGKGEIGYKIWLDDDLVVDGQMSGVGDGDFIAIGDERILTLPKTHGTTFTVKAEVAESGQHQVYPTRTHTFFIDDATVTGAWTQTGDNSIEQANGTLDVKLRYTLTAD